MARWGVGRANGRGQPARTPNATGGGAPTAHSTAPLHTPSQCACETRSGDRAPAPHSPETGAGFPTVTIAAPRTCGLRVSDRRLLGCLVHGNDELGASIDFPFVEGADTDGDSDVVRHGVETGGAVVSPQAGQRRHNGIVRVRKERRAFHTFIQHTQSHTHTQTYTRIGPTTAHTHTRTQQHTRRGGGPRFTGVPLCGVPPASRVCRASTRARAGPRAH